MDIINEYVKLWVSFCICGFYLLFILLSFFFFLVVYYVLYMFGLLF